MKRVKGAAFQGDVMFKKVESLPKGVTREEGSIVAHSETGHHHVVEAPVGSFVFYKTEDPMTSYLHLEEPAQIVHKRSFDTHEPLQLPAGDWQIRRQREWTPEGWAMVAD